MIAQQPTTVAHNPTPSFVEPSFAKSLVKTLVVAGTVAGLAVGIFFGVSAIFHMIAIGSIVAWKLSLEIVGVAAAVSAILGAHYFAFQHNMFYDTGKNLEDSSAFIVDTFLTPFHATAALINHFRSSNQEQSKDESK